MHKIKNNPISNDDAVNKKYVDDNTTTKQDKTDNTLNTTDKTVIGAINELNKNFMKSITFNDTNLTITYKNGKVTTVPLNDFISGIIAKANLFSMVVVDALPTVADNGDGTYTITYTQSGTSKTTNNENTWFLYDVNGTYKETMFVGTTEITRDAGSIDLSNYVNKLTDVISTWDFTDLTKIPTMASLKNGITTTIDSSSTDTQVPTAKAVYNNINKDNNIKTYTSLEQLGLTAPITVGDLYNAMPDNSICRIKSLNYAITDTPTDYGILKIDKIDIYSFDIEFKRSKSNIVTGCNRWIGQLKGSDGTGLTWSRVCTTSVDDVGKTNITSRVSNATVNSGGGVSYSVKNGICYVQIQGIATTVASNGQRIISNSNIPNPDYELTNGHYTIVSPNATNGLVVFDGKGGIIYYGGAMTIYTTISYPVKES